MHHETRSTHRFEGLDGLRAVAALGVLLLHFGHVSASWLAPHAPLAVDFFFMLSGFVIACSYEARLGRSLRTPEFMLQRLIRLYPLIAAGALLGVAGYFNAYHGATMAIVLLTGLLLVPTPLAPLSEGRMAIPINPPSWSLSFELLVNLTHALIVPVLTPRLLGAIVLSFGIALAGTSYCFNGLGVGATWPTILGAIPRVAFSYFAGVGMYRLWKAGGLKALRAPLLVPAIALLVVFAVPPGHAWNWLFDLAVVTILFPLLVIIGANARPARARGLCRIGGELSYPAYILQGPFSPHIAALPDHLHLAGFGAALVIAIALLAYLMLCWLVTIFYDIPLRSLIKANLTRRSPALR